jgi:hypothetical protein
MIYFCQNSLIPSRDTVPLGLLLACNNFCSLPLTFPFVLKVLISQNFKKIVYFTLRDLSLNQLITVLIVRQEQITWCPYLKYRI